MMEAAKPVVAILAGGLATRLGDVAKDVPKSLVEVAGEPFLAHQLRLLAVQGFREVVLCVGHRGKEIESFAGNGAAFGVRLRYSLDGPQLLGTGGALRKALPLLGYEFMVLYGDSYLRTAFLPVWNAFAASGKAALMTVFHNEGRWGASNIELSYGEILRYDKAAPTAAMQHIDYGVGCIRAKALQSFAREDEPFDLALFYAEMLRCGQMASYVVDERFYEIGSPAGLAETDALLRAKHAKSK
jgi:NDP-sugar pyrophosphorylase family protein